MTAGWLKMVYAVIAGIAVGLFAGLAIASRHAPIPSIEPPSPAIRQTDGSLVLERKPDITAKPKQIAPPGGIAERIVQVAVQPKVDLPALPKVVTVDLTLYGMPDGSKRVVASSPDGVVTGGVDIPIKPIAYNARPHEAGFTYGAKSYGAYYSRAYGSFTTGVEVRRIYSGLDFKSWDASIRIGYRW